MKDDLISRQAAIDALNVNIVFGRCNGKAFTFQMLKKYAEFVRGKIDALPSAQSEVVRCKDCKHKPSGDGVNHRITFPDERCPCQCDDYWYSWLPDDDWFCGNAERREDG